MPPDSFEDEVAEQYGGFRLDVYLADRIEDASRSFVKRLIKEERVKVGGEVCTKPSRTVAAGERVEVELPDPPTISLEPENIPLDIRYQDEHIVIVNKSSGLVVHPGTGNYSGTLVHALLYHCPDFARPGSDPTRPGIVHRLDKDTSGVLVVAKTPAAFLGLSEQVRERSFSRRYIALVRGEYKEDRGRIEVPIGRSLADRSRMSVSGVHGRDAVTYFEVLERFGAASLLGVRLETGRTHQIRVHLRFTGHPVLGDPVYGETEFAKWPVSSATRRALEGLKGQALHAEMLGLRHPISGQYMEFIAPPPAFFAASLGSVMRASQAFLGLFSGPVLALFLLGVLTRRGTFGGWCFGLAIALPSTIYVQHFTKVHLIYYFPLSFLLCFIVGYLASLPTGRTATAGLTLRDLREEGSEW